MILAALPSRSPTVELICASEARKRRTGTPELFSVRRIAAYRTPDTLRAVSSAESETPNSPTPARLSGACFQWPGGRGVSDIDLQVERGQVIGLLGPNGAGKSTILKMLSGEIEPQQGSVTIFDQPHGREARRRIGLVLQEPSTDDLMTLEETLQLHGRLFGLRGRTLHRRSDELLDSLGLGERAGDRCETLSGGLRRRLDLARSLLHEPELLLLDEPTLALDPDSSAAIWDTLSTRVSAGVAVVVCSNDTAEAEAYANRVVIVDEGQVVAEDTPASLTSGLLHDALELDWPSATGNDVAELERWPGVGTVLWTEDQIVLTVEESSEIVPHLFQRYGSQIDGIRIRESSLRDAWFQIVGRPLTNSREDER
ncbi:MAG: ATP-binding cassette domain-containing protein [Chloroflexi bacterium]|nr:ATP-binding cassette domain-containing protein [Chloroflexota bacterium]MYJ93632.1 ATP-binding cassette domain-containing protein [Chloroflexota bacterium]